MRKHYQYILVFLSLIIVYELYLIISFKYIDIQKDQAIETILEDNEKIKKELEVKKRYFEYTNTLSYRDKIAKTSQNRKNPGEEVVFIVSKEDMEQYKKIDIEAQIYSEKQEVKPTYGMTNEQKWVYYIFRVDLRD